MSIALRICLFDEISADDATQYFDRAATADRTGPEFFEELEGVVIIDRCTDWNSLQEHLRFGKVDAVVVNLDRKGDNPRFLSIQRIAEVAPDCAIIGVSSDTRPDTIIGAMRAGCSQFVRVPIDPTDLRDAIDRIRQTRLPVAGGRQQIAVIGSAGGAGSTTLACNLALELARLAGRRVALVDMNLQFGDVACTFDRVPKYSVADLCRGGVTIDRTLLETALDELPCNVSILPRPENLEETEDVRPDAVEQLFRGLAQMFPFVITDLPRYFSLPMMAALRTSDRILIVSQLAVPFVRNATRIYQCLLQTGINEEGIEFVLNRCNANHERVKPAEVEKHFGRPVFAVIPNDYKHITASRDLGHPILASAPNSPARLAIEKLARQLAAPYLGTEGVDNERRSFFGRFFKTRSPTKQPTGQAG